MQTSVVRPLNCVHKRADVSADVISQASEVDYKLASSWFEDDGRTWAAGSYTMTLLLTPYHVTICQLYDRFQPFCLAELGY